MKTKNTLLITFALASVTALAACAQAPDTAAPTTSAPMSEMPTMTHQTHDVAALPLVVVSKSPSCGCCGQWVEHMRAAGFTLEVHNMANMNPVKERVGVPPGKGSCHTAEVAGYFIEGHVPAEDVQRLLAERPAARGLAVPGMPMGSPGMPVAPGHEQPYDVLLVAEDGSTSVYARHND
jgi:hypothetical protein